MDKLQARGVVEGWMRALKETTGAKRPGWSYMKAVLESWLAAGAPSIGKNGSDPVKPAKKVTHVDNWITGEKEEV
jgi:DNA replication protein DnaD